jgi:hypothetical protein
MNSTKSSSIKIIKPIVIHQSSSSNNGASSSSSLVNSSNNFNTISSLLNQRSSQPSSSVVYRPANSSGSFIPTSVTNGTNNKSVSGPRLHKIVNSLLSNSGNSGNDRRMSVLEPAVCSLAGLTAASTSILLNRNGGKNSLANSGTSSPLSSTPPPPTITTRLELMNLNNSSKSNSNNRAFSGNSQGSGVGSKSTSFLVMDSPSNKPMTRGIFKVHFFISKFHG